MAAALAVVLPVLSAVPAGRAQGPAFPDPTRNPFAGRGAFPGGGPAADDRAAPLRIRLIDGEVLEADATGPTLRVYHFWASWHRGSLDSLPQLAALTEQFGPRGVTFISVALDLRRDDARAALEQAGALGVAHWHHAFNLEHRPSLDAVFHDQRYTIPNVVLLSPHRRTLYTGDVSGLASALEAGLARYDPAALAAQAEVEAAAGMSLADAVALLNEVRTALRGSPPDFVFALQRFNELPEAYEDRPEVLAEVRDLDRMLAVLPSNQEPDWRNAVQIVPRAAVRLERLRQIAVNTDVATRRVEVDEAVAIRRMQRADTFMSRGNRAAAYRDIKWVAENAPSSYVGQQAAARLAEFEQDAELMAEVKDADRRQEAGAKLSLAKSYIAAGSPELARPLLETISADYADLQEAQDAAELLRTLR